MSKSLTLCDYSDMNMATYVGGPQPRSRIILGSSLAFVIGATIMIFLHEASHAVAGAVQGYHPQQLPFAVGYSPEPPDRASVIALLAGPVFSLASGVVGVLVDRRWRPFRDRPLWRLVWLWTVFASIQEGLGYLQVTAFLEAGDTGQAFALLDLPPSAYIAATVIGWIGLPITAWIFAAPIRELASSESDRTALTVWPWLIGTAGLVALMAVYVVLSPINDVSTIVAVLAGAMAIGVYAPMSMMFRSGGGAAQPPVIGWPPTGGLVLLAALVAGNLLLTQGWIWP